jgi:hypothetical protein
VIEHGGVFDYIRHVSGYGPRCGCGGEAALHVGTGSPAKPGIFLCADCVTTAVGLLFMDQPDQPPYWPGDEGRDERYVDPREPAA